MKFQKNHKFRHKLIAMDSKRGDGKSLMRNKDVSIELKCFLTNYLLIVTIQCRKWVAL